MAPPSDSARRSTVVPCGQRERRGATLRGAATSRRRHRSDTLRSRDEAKRAAKCLQNALLVQLVEHFHGKPYPGHGPLLVGRASWLETSASGRRMLVIDGRRGPPVDRVGHRKCVGSVSARRTLRRVCARARRYGGWHPRRGSGPTPARATRRRPPPRIARYIKGAAVASLHRRIATAARIRPRGRRAKGRARPPDTAGFVAEQSSRLAPLLVVHSESVPSTVNSRSLWSAIASAQTSLSASTVGRPERASGSTVARRSRPCQSDSGAVTRSLEAEP